MVFRFGELVLDTERRHLRHGSEHVQMSAKLFDTLTFLVTNRGRIVSEQELLTEVWRGVSVSSNTVQKTLSDLRKCLQSYAGTETLIQTIRGQGYTFVCEVIEVGSPVPEENGPIEHARWSRRWVGLGSAVVMVIILILAGLSIIRRSEVPRIVQTIQLTHTSASKIGPVLSDGTRAYFTQSDSGHFQIADVSLSGGESAVLPSTVPDSYACALSPNRSEMLVRSVGAIFDNYGPLWRRTLRDQQAIPVGVDAFDGSWTPDGKEITYTKGSEVRSIDLRTGYVRRLADVAGYAWWPRWSPDGRRLRFTVSDAKSQETSIWEVVPPGLLPHRLALDNRIGPAACGSWSPDGRYFIFQSFHEGIYTLWALKDSSGTFRYSHPPLTQLTMGPTNFRGATISEDGNTLYARSQLIRGEIIEIVPGQGKYADLLPSGIYAETAAFSGDGSRIAYTTDSPRLGLWQGSLDGSSRSQLISPPSQAAFPQWSPDNLRIAVALRKPGGTWRINLVTPSNGALEELTPADFNAIHPNWSPDGKVIIFGTIPSVTSPERVTLGSVDVITKRLSTLDRSQGLFSPALSPNGQAIAAIDSRTPGLVLFNMSDNNSILLKSGHVAFPTWSRDGASILFIDYSGPVPAISSIDPKTRMERILVPLRGLRILDRWFGIHPNGTLLVVRDESVQEAYALKWIAP